MVYTITDLRGAVRALIQNIPPNIYPDADLDVALAIGKRRLDYDRPNLVSATIAGTGGAYYKLTTTLSDWVNDWSDLRNVIYPVPDVATSDDAIVLDYKSRKLVRLGNDDYIFVTNLWQIGKNASLQYTAQWLVAGLDEATSTTLTAHYQSALELIGAARACTSLAAKAAGTIDDQIPADQINYRSIEQEYSRRAAEFVDLYNDVLNINPNGTKAIIVRADYDAAEPSRFLTHRRTLGTN